jgi:hypothetical protein
MPPDMGVNAEQSSLGMQNDVMDDPYRELGVPRTATVLEVKRAYRRLSMLWHPDRHVGEPEFQRREAERRFKRIHSAYKAITEPPPGSAAVAPGAPQQQQATKPVDPDQAERFAAIRSVVGSKALSMLPGISHHNYRRVTSVVERLVQNALLQGEAAFRSGLDNALYSVMEDIGMSTSLRNDAIKVLDAVIDELQWRGKGADPQTWRQLLAPLEKALRDYRRR